MRGRELFEVCTYVGARCFCSACGVIEADIVVGKVRLACLPAASCRRSVNPGRKNGSQGGGKRRRGNALAAERCVRSKTAAWTLGVLFGSRVLPYTGAGGRLPASIDVPEFLQMNFYIGSSLI